MSNPPHIDYSAFETNHLEIYGCDSDGNKIAVDENPNQVTHIRWIETHREKGKRDTDPIIDEIYEISFSDFSYNKGVVHIKGHKDSVLKEDFHYDVIINMELYRKTGIFGSIDTYDKKIKDKNYIKFHVHYSDSIILFREGIQSNWFSEVANMYNVDLNQVICHLDIQNCIVASETIGNAMIDTNIRNSVFLNGIYEFIKPTIFGKAFFGCVFQDKIYFPWVNKDWQNSIGHDWKMPFIKFIGCHVYARIDISGYIEKIYFSDTKIKGKKATLIANTPYLCIENTDIDDIMLGNSNKIDTIEIKHKSQIKGIHLNKTQVKNFILTNSRIQKINVDSVCDIDTVTTYDSKIDTASQYSIFTRLKDSAIAHNNKIQALEYHTKEMNTYRWELWKNWQWKKLDKWVLLSYTKYVSFYSTQPFLVIVWFIVLHILSGYFLYDSVSTSIKNTIPFRVLDDTPQVNFWIELFKNALHYMLLYEITQSFRQFSRKF